MVASYAVAPSVENILASMREIFLKIGVEDKKSQLSSHWGMPLINVWSSQELCININFGHSATGVARLQTRVSIYTITTKQKYKKHVLLGLQTDRNHAQLFNA